MLASVILLLLSSTKNFSVKKTDEHDEYFDEYY